MNSLIPTQKFVLSALVAGLLLPALAQSAAIVYDTAGFNYTQNFDSLGTSGGAWTNGTTITGWHWLGENGTTPATYTATNGGSATTNQILSMGNNDDRAFGGQNGNDIRTLYYGAQILNSTEFTLSSFTLTYTGEQWRMIQNEVADRLTFQYQIFNAGGGSLSASTGWSSVGELTFIAPRTTTSSSSGLDGNLAANRVEGITATVSGLTWSEGQEIWLRWADNNPVSNNPANGSTRAVMGIDDLSFSAVPEPSSTILIGAAAFVLAARRRRRP